MALHKIRARSEQRGPQGHTGLAWLSSESHRMGRSGTQVTREKSKTTRPRAPVHDLANQCRDLGISEDRVYLAMLIVVIVAHRRGVALYCDVGGL